MAFRSVLIPRSMRTAASLPSPPLVLASEEAFELGRQLVPGGRSPKAVRRQPLLSVLLGFQLADQGGVLFAARDQLLDLVMGGAAAASVRAEVSSSRSARRASPSSRAAAAAGYGMADT